jgi:hypothetical protein
MTSGNQTRLRDLAVFVRSKNAGPFVLTIDIFFADEAACRRVLDPGVLAAERVAAIYRIPTEGIRVIHVAQANAIKLSIPRPLVAGDVGDCDVAGGQQFAPILDLEIPAAAVRG